MTATGYLRGHRIIWDGEEWRFADTGEATTETWEDRPCGHCGLGNTAEGHDGCLGTLPGVTNACCGHGRTEEAYVQFDDGRCVRGTEAVAAADRLMASCPAYSEGLRVHEAREECRRIIEEARGGKRLGGVIRAWKYTGYGRDG